MRVLSIRNRVEFAILGLGTVGTFGWLAYSLVQTEGDTAGFAALIVGLFGLAIGRQLIFFPPNISLQDWWRDFTQPAGTGTFEHKPVFERWVFWDFRYIYDHTGRLIATEQTINWSDTDPDWRIGDPKDIQIIVTRVESGERLSWLARLRSPQLPAGERAEVIDHDGTVLGHTTYKSN